jgi:hypothetical protein
LKLSDIFVISNSVLLSGCINTINADYQINLINIIGQEKLASILASSQPRQVTNYGNEVWVRLKAEIIKVHINHCFVKNDPLR